MNELERLHLRLTEDTASAFLPAAGNRLQRTVQGRAWLCDYAAYQLLKSQLERQGLDVSHLLNQRFGLHTGTEIP